MAAILCQLSKKRGRGHPICFVMCPLHWCCFRATSWGSLHPHGIAWRYVYWLCKKARVSPLPWSVRVFEKQLLTTKDTNRIRSVCPFYVRKITPVLFLILPTNYRKSKVENKQTRNKQNTHLKQYPIFKFKNIFYPCRYSLVFPDKQHCSYRACSTGMSSCKTTVTDLAHFVVFLLNLHSFSAD